MAPRPARLLLLLAIVATIGCDRVTKHAAVTTLAGAPAQSFMADTVRLEYMENSGAFLGLGSDWPRPVRVALFSIGNGLFLLAVAIMAIRHRWTGLALAGVALFVAGGVSNLLDRMAFGTVIDFMNVGIGPVRTGIFNVADMAILAGVGLVLLAASRGDRGGRGSRSFSQRPASKRARSAS
jgi:signal peptidase II